MTLRLNLLLTGWLSLLAATPATSAEPMPLFDAHMHYNWEPKPYYSIDEVLTLFRKNNISGVLATSRPNDGTRALVDAKPNGILVVPFIRPYNVRSDIQTWYNDPNIFDLIEVEYARGYYKGIGEFHLTGMSADSDWVKRTVNFAVEKNLYLHAHADDTALEILFSHNAKAKVIWAHTGFGTSPDKVARYLDRYPQLWGELSYRYGITEGGVRLADEWKNLFLKYPDRFLVGSDTWTNDRWESYTSIMNEYRNWLVQLPRDVAEKIAFRNAARLFGGK